MGRIQSSVGLVTGIQIEETVNKLMEIAAQPRDTLAVRRKGFEAQQAAVTDLTALVLGVQLAIRRLKPADLFRQKSVTSSNSSLLTATAGAGAAAGQYQLTPARKSSSHQLFSSGLASRDQPLGAGEFTVRFGGHVDQAISLDDLNGGAGVARGKIKLTDRAGGTAVIDLRFAQTIDDVVAAINAADDVEITASVSGDRLKLVDTSGGSGFLKVQEVSGGTTAAGLGLAAINVQANEAVGTDIVSLFNGLELSRLNDGNGLSLRAGMPDLEVTFRNGSAALSIDLNPTGPAAPTTLGEIITKINAADPTRLQAAISGDGDRIVLTDLTAGAGTFAVTSPFQGTVARELGLTTTAAGGTITGSRILSGLKSTLLTTLGGGAGLGTLGQILLTDRSGSFATVGLSGAETLDDVLETINSAGLGLKAQYNPARNGLQIVDTTGLTTNNLIIANADATNTATKLGIAANVAATQINSGSLDRQVVSRSTLLSSYNAGRGVAAGSFLITDSAGAAAAINLASLNAKTIGEVIDAINALTIGVEAKLNDAGDGIALVNTAGGGGRLQVSEVGTGKAAADLRILGVAKDVTINNQTTQVIDGSTTYRIVLDADDTLNDLASRLNAANGNFSASIISQTTGSLRHHLSLSSGISGNAGELLVDGTALGMSFQETAPAQDAILQLGTGPAATLLSSATNVFDEVLTGVDVTLTGQSTDAVTLTIAETADAASGALQTFVDNFNKLREKLDSYNFFSPEQGTKGVLFGSSESLRLDSDLSRLLTGRYFGLGEVESLAELGISIDDKGKLSFDKAKFQTRYDADPAAVEKFFTDETLGFAGKADAMIERLVGRDNSVLVNRATALSRILEDNAARIAAQDDRLARQRERLLMDFFRIEQIVSRIRNNLTAINQIQALPPLFSTNSQ